MRNTYLNVALALIIARATFAPANAEPRTEEQLCANVAATAVAARNERQQKRLVELEQQLRQRVQELDSKRMELQKIVDQIDAFARKADETLIDVYSRMKPDSAAEQLKNLDEESAASLLLGLKPKVSSAILSLMEASHAALLLKRVSKLSATARLEKKL